MHTHLTRAALLVTALSIPVLSPVAAQDTKPKERERTVTVIREPGTMSLLWAGAADRAVLGVTLGAATRADTAGVRIDAVEDNGPAAKAGLKAGDLITEINGVSLRVSSADAEDLALAGIAQRRLQRTLAKAKPGDEVALTVRSGGSLRSVKVKTVSAAELSGRSARTPMPARVEDDRSGAIGITVGGSGSARDTLGLFVSSVVGGGPAEKAGVIEGERIAAVNGVDVRVPKEDLEDGAAASARVNRMVREIRKVAPGSPVTLRVYSSGRYRDVSVTAVKMSDLMPPGRIRIGGSINGEPFDMNSEAFEQAMERLRDRMQNLRIEMPRSGVRMHSGDARR